MTRTLSLSLVTLLAAAPAFAHGDGTVHAHHGDYTALVVVLSMIAGAAACAVVLEKIRK